MTNRRDQRFDDGASTRNDFRESGRRIDPRKIAQLCAQIRETLQLTMLGEIHDSVLADVEVESVEPTPDPGRLRVVFAMHEDCELPIGAIQSRVEAARGVFHNAIANAINRRRVPDLELCVRSPQSE